MDEATLRRIIREELDNYDRDKGITPRRSANGIQAAFQKQFLGDGPSVHPSPRKPEGSLAGGEQGTAKP